MLQIQTTNPTLLASAGKLGMSLREKGKKVNIAKEEPQRNHKMGVVLCCVVFAGTDASCLGLSVLVVFAL